MPAALLWPRSRTLVHSEPRGAVGAKASTAGTGATCRLGRNREDPDEYCLDFAQAAEHLESDRINIFERWESDAPLEALRNLPDDGGQTPPILDAGARRYRVSSVEPV
jgi:hypothetical protein